MYRLCRARALWLLASIGALAPSHAALACEGAPWIRLEVTAGEMAPDEAAEWIEIDRDGCVLSGYPGWDRRAGVYQRTMGADEVARLTSVLEAERILAFDPQSVRQALAASKRVASAGPFARTVFQISDADRVRLLLDDAGKWKTITWHSPRLELEQRRGLAARAGVDAALEDLQRLVNVLDAVRRSGDHPAKARVAEVRP